MTPPLLVNIKDRDCFKQNKQEIQKKKKKTTKENETDIISTSRIGNPQLSFEEKP